MACLKVLICGGGCAGPSLAFWLSRAGHNVTIVERYPALRAAGAQIDIRAQGIQVARRMGLLEAIRAKCVGEDGFALVDSANRVCATLLANKSGQGAQSFTSEYEIMRGDLVRVLHDATKDNVQYIFGKTVDTFEQNEKRVTVHFSDGTVDTYDMLVGADGQGSRIRKAILPPSTDPYRRLGAHAAFFFVPPVEDHNELSKIYVAPGGRTTLYRSHSPTESHAYFHLRDDKLQLGSIHRAPVQQQKEFWEREFSDAGWQTERLLQGMKETDNFYCQEIVQVRIDKWYDGRVILLGDACYCPSPFSGLGTTGSLVGAYVLAGEILHNIDNLPTAFANYESLMRPLVNELQNINPKVIKYGMPNSRWGVRIFYTIARIVTSLGIPALLTRFSRENHGGWLLPDYPELR